MMFRDRTHAGRLLAGKLEPFRAERPIILGLTRGGVPVAVEVARLLEADLDVLVVHKVLAPGTDHSIGAVAEDGAVFLSREALRDVGARVDEAWVDALAAREGAEIARRMRMYRGERPLRELAGRTVILVDDGVATGATARAAALAARQHGAVRVVLAAPVIAAAAAPALRSQLDAIVAVDLPEPFFAVAQWYERFEQVTDEDVIADLHRAGGPDGAVELEQKVPEPDPKQ